MDIFIDTQSVLAFFHVLLFGYWLGADLGVYYCDSQLVRDDLDLEERLRVRKIRLKLDMVPRTCLILILAFGFTLALQYSSPVTGIWLALVWAVSLAWLYVVWQIHFKAGTSAGEKLAQLDIWWRYIVSVALIFFGLYCIINGGPVSDNWLSFKFILFGVIILNGVWIRKIAARWQPIFDKVRAGGEDRVQGEALMKVNRKSAGMANMTIWTLVMIMAFVGQTKLF